MQKKTLTQALALSAALVAAGTALGQSGESEGEPAGPVPKTEDGKVMLGSGKPGGVGVWTPDFGIFDPIAPLETVPFKPWAKALYDARQVHEMEPHARCKASAASRQFLTPYGAEFLEMEEVGRLYIFDVGGPHTFRTVYMDGRSHPSESELEPSNYGHSVGWWEGDTLVIDTVGYNEDFWFGRRGLPHTEQLHTIERFTRTDYDTIDYKITIDDPGAYTAPFVGGFNLEWEEGVELFEYICQQANMADELMVGGGRTSVERTSPIAP